MDLDTETHERPDIRKIEDIIDIQKANGNIRQVAFKLPSETDSSISANLAKSLETGLSRVKLDEPKKKKKLRPKSHKNLASDAISWPSDSDITVLRMKVRGNKNMIDKMGNLVPGDGLHHPDSSSMVNLATLILQSQPPSKQSLSVEEYLLPLTSWEHGAEPQPRKLKTLDFLDTNDIKSCNPSSSHKDDQFYKFNEDIPEPNTKSKVAKFLRLYFCPCCTCLYELEKMQEEQSTCFTKY